MANEADKKHTRLPITVYVDRVEFDPDVDFSEVVRTSYDLELNEYQMKKIVDGIQHRLDSNLPKSIRIRVIGRLVS